MMEPTAELSTRLGLGAGGPGLGNLRRSGEELGLRIFKALELMNKAYPNLDSGYRKLLNDIELKLVRPSGI